MPLPQTNTLLLPARADQRDLDGRAWFLRDSNWEDVVWILAPTNALDEREPVRLRWDFALRDGRRFTDARYGPLLRTSRQLIGLIRNGSPCTGLSLRPSTVRKYFFSLRALLRWMDQEGFTRFADLDATALLQFQHWLTARPMVGRPTRAAATVQRHLYVLTCLHRLRNELEDGLHVDPFPRSNHRQAASNRDGLRRPWPHTPDSAAVTLVLAAVNMVGNDAAGILLARETYRQAAAAARPTCDGSHAHTSRATRALRCAGGSHTKASVLSVSDLVSRIDMLYAACFVVISYLVGPRVSEILHLKAGCVQARCADAGGETVAVIVGSIYKHQPGFDGHPHEWVAPPPAVRAVEVLEALSAAHRAVTGRSELWLRRRRGNGATEWHDVDPERLEVPSTARINTQMQRFGRSLGLTQDEQPWRLTSHQGRKTFARFAALRDRTCLFALAQQLGHRERAETDQGYVGSDYRLSQEIDAEILQQSVDAWEHMLAAPGLGGRAGVEIVAKRPRFRGSRMKQDLKGYARLLVDAGLVLGVCDWGYCVYREEHSACLGNAAGPNAARREPSTCARCKNFVVSEPHRPYWTEQAHRSERMLDEPALPLETLRIVRQRLNEARSLIRAIDATGSKGSEHDREVGP